MKIGDLMVYEPRAADARGFRDISVVRINWIDHACTDGHVLCVVRPHVTYHYHPEHPERGAYLPPKTMECAAFDELAPYPEGSPLLRDLLIARSRTDER